MGTTSGGSKPSGTSTLAEEEVAASAARPSFVLTGSPTVALCIHEYGRFPGNGVYRPTFDARISSGSRSGGGPSCFAASAVSPGAGWRNPYIIAV